MCGKYDRCNRRSDFNAPRPLAPPVRIKQPPSHRKESERRREMPQQARQVESRWVQTTQLVVQRKREPWQRLVWSHPKTGEHPADLIPAQAPDINVFDNETHVVPINEPVRNGGGK